MKDLLDNTTHKIIFGDSRHMSEIEDESVNLVVTSPPYWNLKDYGNSNEIGKNQTYGEYLENLFQVFKECIRVLKPDGKICITIHISCIIG